MGCEYCEIAAGNSKSLILHQDAEIVVAVKDTSVIPGQITVFPTEHHPIMELVPDNILQKCSIMANKVSVAIFEGLDTTGTNVIIQNGTAAGQNRPHFAIEIIPRRENDGLDFQWPQKQLTEDELGYLFNELTEEVPEEKPAIKPKKVSGKDNYLLKSLKRKA